MNLTDRAPFRQLEKAWYFVSGVHLWLRSREYRVWCTDVRFCSLCRVYSGQLCDAHAEEGLEAFGDQL